MWRAPIWLLMGGCFSRPDPPGGVTPGGDGAIGDATPCTAGFAVAVVLPTSNGAIASDPYLSPNELDLYFTYDPNPGSGAGVYEIGHAKRVNTAEVFSIVAQPESYDAATFLDQDPALTADGLTIMFVSTRDTNFRAWRASRPDNGAPWGVPEKVPGLETVDAMSLDLSPDGDDIYFSDGARNLHHARRSSASYAVDTKVPVPAIDATFPTASANGLELFYNGSMANPGVKRAQRTSVLEAFGPPILVNSAYADPHLSPDGEALVVKAGGQLMLLRRTCAAL